MSKQKEKELERAARLEKHRQEAYDARAAHVAARHEADRLSKEYDSIYQAGLAHLCEWETIVKNGLDADCAADRETMRDWSKRNLEYDVRTRSALEAWNKAHDVSNQTYEVYKRKEKVVERDEARVARAAARSVQKQKAAEFKKAMEIMRERLVDVDDFYL